MKYPDDFIGKVIEGNCLSVMRDMPDKCVDITVTSPPYNQLGGRIPDKPTGMHKNDGWLKKVKDIGYSDDMTEPDYQEWCRAVVSECMRISKGLVWFNHKIRYRDGVGIHPLSFLPFPFWSEVVWDRGGSMVLNARKYAPSHEYIWGFGKPHHWSNNLNTKMTVWRVAPQLSKTHPCPYPEDIISPLIASSCPPGGIVFDPFMGSGTTGVCAVKYGMRFCGTEKSPTHCENARKRIAAEQAQGKLF